MPFLDLFYFSVRILIRKFIDSSKIENLEQAINSFLKSVSFSGNEKTLFMGTFKNIRIKPFLLLFWLLFLLGTVISCQEHKKGNPQTDFTLDCDTLSVKASAYVTSKNRINLTAWGDTLKPGMEIVAVSRDLLKNNLKYNSKIKIEGLDGFYVVKDKMHPRWRNKIDIYMGHNRQKAVKWGACTLKICVLSEEDSEINWENKNK